MKRALNLLQQVFAKKARMPPYARGKHKSPAAHLSQDDCRRLNQQGLFIIGSARSGTTILCDCLNRSPEVFLFLEADFFRHHPQKPFVDSFNRRHAAWGTCRVKGNYCPPLPLPEHSFFDTLLWLGHQYPLVGEKVALGSVSPVGDHSLRDILFEFQARYFFASKYLHIVRRPAESILSLLRLFPAHGAARAVYAWLSTVVMQVEMCQTFASSWLLFYEDLSPETFQVLTQVLEISCQIPKGFIDASFKKTRVKPGDIPDALREYAEELEVCQEVYDALRDAFCPKTLQHRDPRICYSNRRDNFASRLCERLHEVTSQLQQHLDTPETPSVSLAHHFPLNRWRQGGTEATEACSGQATQCSPHSDSRGRQH